MTELPARVELTTYCVACAAEVLQASAADGSGSGARLFEVQRIQDTRGAVLTYDADAGRMGWRVEQTWLHRPHQCDWRAAKRLDEARYKKVFTMVSTRWAWIEYTEENFQPYVVDCPTCPSKQGEKCRNLSSKKQVKHNLHAHQQRNHDALAARGLEVVQYGGHTFIRPIGGRGKRNIKTIRDERGIR